MSAELEALTAALRRLRRELEGVVGSADPGSVERELLELVRREEELVCADLLEDATLAADRRERLARMTPLEAARFVRGHTLEVLSGMGGSDRAFEAALALILLEARVVGRLEAGSSGGGKGVVRRLPMA